MPVPTKKLSPWEDIVLRIIAIYKCLHGLFFFALGFGAISLKHKNIPQVLNDWVIKPLQFPPESHMVKWALNEADKLTAHSLNLIGDLFFFYGALFLIEGIGLYLRKPWAEYLVVIVTGSLLPIEIYFFVTKTEWWKAGAIVGNVLIVLYLIHRLRLDAHNARQKENPGQPGASTPETSQSRVVSGV